MPVGQQVNIALSRTAETALGTLPTTDAEYTNFGFTDRSPALQSFETEDTSQETGGSDEFASDNFPVSAGLNKTLQAVASSELMAFIAGHGAKVVKTGVGPFTYTSTFKDRAVDGEDASSFGLVQELGAYDPGFSGNAIASWSLNLQRGPGRSNATITINVVGIGKETNPSTITMPAKLSQSDLLSASLLLTAVGADYVAAKTINSLEFTVDNGIDPEDMFFPGSGVDANGFALGGRIRYGQRTMSLSINAEFVAEATEINKLKAQTEGATTIQLINSAAAEEATITLPRTVFSALSFSEGPQNRVTMDGQIKVLKPGAGDIFELEVITALDDFGDAAA